MQTFTVGGGNTGTYSLAFNGQTAAGINYSDNAAQIQADLQGLSSIGGAGGQVSVTETSISGGANDQQQIVISSTVADQATFQLTFGPTAFDPNIYTTGNIVYDKADYIATEINIYNALDGLNDIGGISPTTGLAVGGLVTAAGSNFNGGEAFTITFLGGLADTPGLPTIGVVSNPAITISHLRYGSLPTKTFRAVFLGSFAGVSEPALTSAAAASGGTIVSPPAISLTGGTANVTPDQWFSNFQGTGSANTAINNVQVYNSDSTTTENASGPVTSICVDASDSDVIYIATAGGGAWKTEDGGLTWTPLFDSAFELANPAVMFGGVITQDPNHVNILYYGTGENADAPDEFYGSGVYESTNAGGSWTLLTGTTSSSFVFFSNTPYGQGNPFLGMTIGSIVVNPEQIGSIAVTANYAGAYGNVNGAANGLNNGVWEYDGTNWNPILVQGSLTENGTTTLDMNGAYTEVITPIVTTGLYVGMSVSSTAAGLPAGTVITDIGPDAATGLPANAIAISNFPTLPTPPAAGAVSFTFTTSTLQEFGNDNFSSLVYDPASSGDSEAGVLMVGVSSLDASGSPDFGIYTTQVGTDFFGAAGTGGGPWIFSNTNNFNVQSTYASTSTGFMGAPNGLDTPDPNTGIGLGNPTLGYPSQPPPLYDAAGTIMLAANTANVSGSQNTSLASNYAAYYAGISSVGQNGQLFDVQWIDLGALPPNLPNPPYQPVWSDVADALNFPPTGPAGPDLLENPGGLNNIPDYMGFSGWYANSIASYGNYVFVGGSDQESNEGFVLMSADNGTTWSVIAIGGTTPTLNGPFTSIRSLEAYGASLSGTPTTLYATTDGGVWAYNVAAGTWTDITGNLADAQFVSASADPNNPTIALASGHSIGAAQYNVVGPIGTQSWNEVTAAAANTIGGNTAAGINGTNSLGGQIEFDPANPSVAWFYEQGNLMVSTNANSANPVFTSMLITPGTASLPFALDPNNAQRIVAVGNLSPATNVLLESTNLGASWSNISTGANYPGINITSLAISDFQGQYQADPSFNNLPANPPNTVDSGTIYITDGAKVYVTKNDGVSWSGSRTPSLVPGTTIQQIVVDPADRDTVFAVTSGTTGSTGKGHVFESTNAGQTWTDITGGVNGLADAAVWTLAIDPRNSNLYVGTDTGVYELAGGQITAANNWVRFGAGLPFVQVRDIEINTNANMLTIATYGRGMYQYYLDDTQPSAGAFRRSAATTPGPARSRWLARPPSAPTARRHFRMGSPAPN